MPLALCLWPCASGSVCGSTPASNCDPVSSSPGQGCLIHRENLCLAVAFLLYPQLFPPAQKPGPVAGGKAKVWVLFRYGVCMCGTPLCFAMSCSGLYQRGVGRTEPNALSQGDKHLKLERESGRENERNKFCVKKTH